MSSAYLQYSRELAALSGHPQPQSAREASREMLASIDEKERQRTASSRQPEREADVEESLNEDEFEMVGRIQRNKQQRGRPAASGFEEEEIPRDDHEAFDHYVEELNDEHPFAPRISMKSREIWEKNQLEPIHLRYQEELEKKHRNLEALKKYSQREREEKERKEGLLVGKGLPKPSQSRPKPRPAEGQKPLYEKGMAWLRSKNDKIIYRQSEKLEGELTGLDFRPAINRDSAYYASLSKSFDKRQSQYTEDRSKKKRELEQRVYGQYKFKPLLSEKSDVLARKRRAKEEILEKARVLREKHGFDLEDRSEEPTPEDQVFRAPRTKTASRSQSREGEELVETTVSEFEKTRASASGRKAPAFASVQAAGPRGQKAIKQLQSHQTMGAGMPLKPAPDAASAPKQRRVIKRLPEDAKMPSPLHTSKQPKELVPSRQPARDSPKKPGKPLSSRRLQDSDKRPSLSPRDSSRRRVSGNKKPLSSRHV